MAPISVRKNLAPGAVIALGIAMRGCIRAVSHPGIRGFIDDGAMCGIRVGWCGGRLRVA
jgi:hypothetical protein